jgi:hypothetical protein
MRKKQITLQAKLKQIVLAINFIACPIAFAYDPLDCLNDISKIDPKIIVGLAVKLCSGAYSPEPVKCYEKIGIIDDGMIRGIAIDLCAGSMDANQTTDCYVKAGKEKLNRGLAATLCGVKKIEK